MSEIKLHLTDEQPRRSDFVKNRELLLQTARRLFIKHSVEAVSMSDVAKAAGVGQGTLYRHFENKLELAMALLDEEQRNFQERTLHMMREPGDARSKLEWFITEALQFVERNAPMLCVSTDIVGSMQHTAHWWWRQTIRGLLEQLLTPGNLDFLADSIYVMLDVHNVYFLRQARGFSPEDITANVLELIGRITR